MGEIRDYKDLMVWKAARRLVQAVYRVSDWLPKDEVFGLRQQIRRAAVSVPSNIAEGYGRGSKPDYIRFLRIARGSLYEVETQWLLAGDLQLVPEGRDQELDDAFRETVSLLGGLLKSLEQ